MAEWMRTDKDGFGAAQDRHVFNLCKWCTGTVLHVPWIFDRWTEAFPTYSDI